MSSLFTNASATAARKQNYNKADDASASREERMNRLKFELREHIRFLADYELLSTDWLRMAESLHQIANVAYMETHLPPTSDNPLSQHGKKNNGTLWDQERDELAVRILLEEGKLNLALRVLHKYKTYVRDTEKWTSLVKATSLKYTQSDLTSILDRCKLFEESLGMLLKLAFSHVESLQIMDLPEFIQHASEVMKEAQEKSSVLSAVISSTPATTTPSPATHEKLQETLVIYYLSSLAENLEEMDEDRVLDLLQESELLPTFITHMNKAYNWYSPDVLIAGAIFLNGIMTAEAYQADRTKFLKDKAVLAQLCEFKQLFLNELLSPTASYGLKKKDIQMLLDEIAKYERAPGVSTLIKKYESGSAVETIKERLEKWKTAAEASKKEKEKAATATTKK